MKPNVSQTFNVEFVASTETENKDIFSTTQAVLDLLNQIDEFDQKCICKDERVLEKILKSKCIVEHLNHVAKPAEYITLKYTACVSDLGLTVNLVISLKMFLGDPHNISINLMPDAQKCIQQFYYLCGKNGINVDTFS